MAAGPLETDVATHCERGAFGMPYSSSDHCDAEQKVWREREGLWHTQIIHDDDCPWFVARQERLKGVGR